MEEFTRFYPGSSDNKVGLWHNLPPNAIGDTCGPWDHRPKILMSNIYQCRISEMILEHKIQRIHIFRYIYKTNLKNYINHKVYL